MSGPRRPRASGTRVLAARDAGRGVSGERAAEGPAGDAPSEVAFAHASEPDVGDYRSLFALDPDNTLTAAGERHARRKSRVRETRWFEEHDPQGRLVACYRIWRERAGDRCARTQFGWERFSPRGELLVREVRFSTRESIAALN